MYYTYMDVTDDGRIFYVGMGDKSRVDRRLGRNKHHTHIAKKYGLNRQIVGSFSERVDALNPEIQLIAEHHTFIDDLTYIFGCNYTKGGEGRPCSDEMKQRMRERIKQQYTSGREPWNKGKTGLHYNITEKQRQQAREALITFNKSKPMLGKQHSNETRAKMRKPHMCSICKNSGHTKTTCPERPVDSINAVTIAQQKRWNRK